MSEIEDCVPKEEPEADYEDTERLVIDDILDNDHELPQEVRLSISQYRSKLDQELRKYLQKQGVVKSMVESNNTIIPATGLSFHLFTMQLVLIGGNKS